MVTRTHALVALLATGCVITDEDADGWFADGGPDLEIAGEYRGYHSITNDEWWMWYEDDDEPTTGLLLSLVTYDNDADWTIGQIMESHDIYEALFGVAAGDWARIDWATSEWGELWFCVAATGASETAVEAAPPADIATVSDRFHVEGETCGVGLYGPLIPVPE